MKYSIVLPYYRRPELWQTLISFKKHYSDRRDYEVIIVEDSKNADDSDTHFELQDIIKCFEEEIFIKCYLDEKVSYNPSHKYNLGSEKATGDFIVLSSPEIWHNSDILTGFDKALEEDPDSYYVCACQAWNGLEFIEWYQHSTERNALFHFCSVISRVNFEKINGFDEKYCDGIGFDDEALLCRIRANGIKIVPKDDLLVVHAKHDKDYIDNHQELIEVNRNLFLEGVQK